MPVGPCGPSSAPATRRPCQQGGAGSCAWGPASSLTRYLTQRLLWHLLWHLLTKLLQTKLLQKHLQLQRHQEHQQTKSLNPRLLHRHLMVMEQVSLLAPAATTRGRCSWTLIIHASGPVDGSGTSTRRAGWHGQAPHAPYPYAHQQDPDAHQQDPDAHQEEEEGGSDSTSGTSIYDTC